MHGGRRRKSCSLHLEYTLLDMKVSGTDECSLHGPGGGRIWPYGNISMDFDCTVRKCLTLVGLGGRNIRSVRLVTFSSAVSS